jgi:benzodiazapine receptor
MNKTLSPNWKFDVYFFWECVLIVFALAFIASLLTFFGMSSGWYQTLPHASWTPPDWVFSLVWTILYVFIAITTFLGIREDERKFGSANVWVFAALTIVALLLNVLWCFSFFYMQSIVWGFVAVLLLTLVILAQVAYTFYVLGDTRDGKATGSLLVIYLIWLIYATSLNGYLLTI